jgi:hypothetical protein
MLQHSRLGQSESSVIAINRALHALPYNHDPVERCPYHTVQPGAKQRSIVWQPLIRV